MSGFLKAAATAAAAVLLVALAGCGDSPRRVNAAAISCGLTEGLRDGVLTLRSAAGASDDDVLCVLGELADQESVAYFLGTEQRVPPLGDREVSDGMWAAWLYGDDGSFMWKFATTREAAIS